MNKIIVLILLCAALCYTLMQSKENADIKETNKGKSQSPPSLSVIFLQDFTESIQTNGVTIVSSNVFTPLFTDATKTLSIHFGVINEHTAHQFVSVTLQAKQFQRPILEEIKGLSLIKTRNIKREYAKAYEKYASDSIAYYAERQAAISSFRHEVDSLIDVCSAHLSPTTDLYSAIAVADRIFNYTPAPNIEHFLLINSDGIHTRSGFLPELHNNPDVLLINQDAPAPKAIDEIVTMELASPEQAIQYVIHHSSLKN